MVESRPLFVMNWNSECRDEKLSSSYFLKITFIHNFYRHFYFVFMVLLMKLVIVIDIVIIAH